MTDPNGDKQAIRELVDEWQRATTAGDSEQVLGLMADDALFLVAGQEPFGKDAFARASQKREVRVEGHSEILELEVTGNWAWMRTRIEVTMTPPDGEPSTRAGYTLTILRKEPDGRWVFARDANLLPPP
jgi:uncharacterized protein (TIGR02246 family)